MDYLGGGILSKIQDMFGGFSHARETLGYSRSVD